MPFIEHDDFTGGLWERGNDWEVPKNGLLECLDAYPLPSGGLRAAWQWTERAPTNMPSASGKIWHGFHMWDNDILDYDILAAWGDNSTSAHTVDVRAIRQVTVPSGTFDLVRQHTDQTMLVVDFADFVTTSDFFRQCYYAMRFGASGQRGVWKYSQAGPTSTITTGGDNAWSNAFSHQDRIFAIERLTRPRFRFTEPGADNFSDADNFLEVAPDYLSTFSFALAGFPSDLFIMKEGDGFFVVQADVTDPIVREFPGVSAPGATTRPVNTAEGLIYLTRNDGVYVWDGGKAVWLSPQFRGTPMTESMWSQTTGVANEFIGSAGFGNRFIFTPKGYCFDFRTKAWFKVSFPNAGQVGMFFQYDFIRSRMICAGYTGTPPNTTMRLCDAVIDETLMTRTTQYSFTCRPDQVERRRIMAREYEIHTYNIVSGSTFDVTITNELGVSQTRTATITNTGNQVARLDFSLPGDVLKTRIVAKSNTAGEAPIFSFGRLRYNEITRYPS